MGLSTTQLVIVDVVSSKFRNLRPNLSHFGLGFKFLLPNLLAKVITKFAPTEKFAHK